MNWAWFFDIDGTLVEIAPSPDRIVVHRDMPPLVRKLHTQAGGAVALITGRSIADADRVLPLRKMAIAGQHGLEVRSADGTMSMHRVRSGNLTQVRLKLLEAVARHEGLMAEYKGLSIALHYRHAPRLAGYAHRMMRSLRSRYVPDFIIQKGKRVVELKPAGKDKGVAIEELMLDPPFAGRIPVFIGDDATDEHGFKVVNKMGGHSVKIGPGRTNARWRLRNVESLREWLRKGMDS
ncbi:MAG: trehalose-phosphatase [Gemmatimonadaceae bacterium]